MSSPPDFGPPPLYSLPSTGKPKDWIQRNIVWLVTGVLLGVSLLIGGFAAGLMSLMKSSDAYIEAVSRAEASPAVRQALGSPIKAGYFLTGQIKVNDSSGRAKLHIPISGPKGSAVIEVVATKSNDQWQFNRLIVHSDSQAIDISDHGP